MEEKLLLMESILLTNTEMIIFCLGDCEPYCLLKNIFLDPQLVRVLSKVCLKFIVSESLRMQILSLILS